MKSGGFYKTEYLSFKAYDGPDLLPLYRVDEATGRIWVAMLRRAFPSDVSNVDPKRCATAEEVAAFLQDFEANSLSHTKIILGQHLGMEGLSYWVKSSLVLYDHRYIFAEDNIWSYSSYEKATPQTFIIETDYNGVLSHPMARYVESSYRKSNLMRDSAVRQTMPCLLVVIPRQSAPLSECLCLFYYKEEMGCMTVNFTPTHIPRLEVVPSLLDKFVPKISMESDISVAADQIGHVIVRVVDPETGDDLPGSYEVFLEATAGYLPKRRVVVAGEPVLVKIKATDLDAGDTIKVKAGWKHITGLAEAIITVT